MRCTARHNCPVTARDTESYQVLEGLPKGDWILTMTGYLSHPPASDHWFSHDRFSVNVSWRGKGGLSSTTQLGSIE